MSLDTALRAYLVSIPTLGVVGTRIYPLLAPNGAAMPYLVYNEIAYLEVPHFQGVENVFRASYQLNLYAHTHQQARELGAIVRRALQVWRDTSGATVIFRAIIDRRSVDTEPREDGSENVDYVVSTDVDIWAVEPQPALT
jgi:hypothetical protein